MKCFFALVSFLILSPGVKSQAVHGSYNPELKQLADSFPSLKNTIRTLLNKEDSLEVESSEAFARYNKKYGFQSEFESKEWKAIERLDSQKNSIRELELDAYFRIRDLFDSLSNGQFNSGQIRELIGAPELKFGLDSAGNVLDSKSRVNDDNTMDLDRREYIFMESAPVGHEGAGEDDEVLARLQKLAGVEKRREVYYYDIPGERFQYFMLLFTNDTAYSALLYRHLD